MSFRVLGGSDDFRHNRISSDTSTNKYFASFPAILYLISKKWHLACCRELLPMPAIRGQMDQRFSRPRQPGRRPLPLSCLTNPRRLMQSVQEGVSFCSRLFAPHSIAQRPSGTCAKAVFRPFKFAPDFDAATPHPATASLCPSRIPNEAPHALLCAICGAASSLFAPSRPTDTAAAFPPPCAAIPPL